MKRQSIQPYWGNITKAYHIPVEEVRLAKDGGCSHVYGEVSEQGIIEFMDEVPLRFGNFADLGSGRANVTAFVAHNYGFKTCYGIEISKSRHEIATGLISEAQHLKGMGKIELRNQDLFQFNLKEHDIDVAFCDNLAFEQSGIERLTQKVVREMKAGSFFISMRQMVWDRSIFSHNPLENTARLTIKTSWSQACPVYVYRISR